VWTEICCALFASARSGLVQVAGGNCGEDVKSTPLFDVECLRNGKDGKKQVTLGCPGGGVA